MFAIDQTRAYGRRILTVVGSLAAVGATTCVYSLATAPVAMASHVVVWGAGADCEAVADTATTVVNEPVRFIVCVTLAGRPLAGHAMRLEVVGPARQVQQEFTTDADGVLRFSLQPTAEGTTRVTLCDDDGCLYGEVAIDVSGSAPTTATAPAQTTTAPVQTSTAPNDAVPTTTGAPTVSPASPPNIGVVVPLTRDGAGDGSSDGVTLLWALVVVLALLLAVATWRGMLVMPIGNDDDPCAELRRRVRQLEHDLAGSGARISSAERRLAEVRASLGRLRERLEPGNAGVDDMQSEELLAEADVTAQRDRRERIRLELERTRAALARCEEGDVMVAPPTAGGEQSSGAGDSAPTDACCDGRNWIGVNVYCGGQATVYGREGGMVFLFCADNLERSAVVTWQGTRWGLGLGGGASAGLFFVVNGPVHPNELPPVVANIMTGFDWDLSLGGSLSKIGRAGITAVRNRKGLVLLRRIWQHANRCHELKQARRADDMRRAIELQTEFRSLFSELGAEGMRELVDKVGESAAKGGMSATEAGGAGANVPLGIGVQVGGWRLTGVETELFEVHGCSACDPSAERDL